ncbi:hypothetical protein TNCV_2952051, partial [Trichonephila clavipes]
MAILGCMVETIAGVTLCHTCSLVAFYSNGEAGTNPSSSFSFRLLGLVAGSSPENLDAEAVEVQSGEKSITSGSSASYEEQAVGGIVRYLGARR